MKPLAIGIDLGGTQVRAALVDESGHVLERAAVATAATAGPHAVMDQIAGVARQVAAGIDRARIIGVGVSAPGPLDAKAGMALSIPTLAGFVNFPLSDALRQRLDMPVDLENDGIAAALGEWQFGAGRGFENMVYVTISTGIGGGVIVDNRLLHGHKGMAGHVGHMSIALNGELCSCGNRGCFEAYASGTAFTNRARKRAMACSATLLGSQGAPIDSRAVFAAAREGDALAKELVLEEATILGFGLTNLLHLFSPEILIVGGGLSNEFDVLFPGINETIQKCAMPSFRDVSVVRAELGGNSGLVGAAALAFSRI